MRKLFLLYAILLTPLAGFGQAWSGILNPLDSGFPGSTSSASRYGIVWAGVGVGGIPVRATACTTIAALACGNGASDCTATIQAALNSCAAGDAVVLGAGTFLVNSHVSVPSNVTLRGSGANQTTVNGKGTGNAPITLGSGTVSYTGPLSITAGATGGSTSITVSATTGLVAGQYGVVSEVNNPSWVTINGTEGNCTWCDGWSTNGTRARGQVVQIVSIVGSVVTITPGLYGSYTQTPTIVPFSAAATMAGVENLQIFANNTGYNNQIYMTKCQFCWAKGIEYNYSDGNPIEIDWGFRDEVRDSYISNAFTHQPGATDSAIFIVLKTSASLIENNILERQHVGVILEWGAAGNVVSYNYSQGNFDQMSTNVLMSGYLHHGAHPQFNLWEGNVGEQLYLDSVWGSSSHDGSFRNWWKGTSSIYTPFATGGRATVTTPFHLAFQAARAVQISQISKFDNFIGDVVGSAEASGIATNIPLVVNPTNRAYDGTVYGYTFGYGESSDSGGGGGDNAIPFTSALLHGVVNNYVSPISITWAAGITHTLPPSFYLGAQPSWWSASLPFPATGPDITGGTGPGGYSYGNPAMHCYLSTMGGTDGGPGSPLTFNADNCYTGGTTAPIASFNPTSVSFSNTAVGASSAPTTITLTNTGNAILTISSIALQTGTQYALSGSTCGATLGIGSSCTFQATFSPTAAGVQADSVVFSGNVSGGPVSLSGTGTQGIATFTPSSFNFGSQAVGIGSAQTISLQNTGTASFSVTSLTMQTGTQFSVSGDTCSGTSLPVSNTCTFNVNFLPTSAGAKSDNVIFAGSISGGPIAVSGTGTTPATPVVAPGVQIVF